MFRWICKTDKISKGYEIDVKRRIYKDCRHFIKTLDNLIGRNDMLQASQLLTKIKKV